MEVGFVGAPAPEKPRRVKDLSGQRFGRLLVDGFAGTNKHGCSLWKCSCDCGERVIASANHLRSGNTKSCGCLSDDSRREACISRSTSHGKACRKNRSRAYSAWANMMQRCTNQSRSDFEHYGGRGISVCDRWKLFQNFHADMGDPPAGMSLDRIDVNGNYSPDNCRWATQSQQMQNTRVTRRYEFNGVAMTIQDAAAKYGLTVSALKQRINKLGMTPSKAVSFPMQPRGLNLKGGFSCSK